MSLYTSSAASIPWLP